jgi:hypothetical protein
VLTQEPSVHHKADPPLGVLDRPVPFLLAVGVIVLAHPAAHLAHLNPLSVVVTAASSVT